MSERDTHFSGFAHLLWSAIREKIASVEVDADALVDGCPLCSMPPEQIAALIEPLIAERAYDLGEYVFNHTTEAMTLFDSFEVLAELGEIPDMTEWPKTDG